MEWIRRIGRALKIIFEVNGSIQRGFEEDQKLNEESQNIQREAMAEASKLSHQIHNRATSCLQKIDKANRDIGLNIKVRQSIDFEDWDMRSHGVDLNVFVSRKANAIVLFDNGFFYVYPVDVYADMIKLGKISDNIESIKEKSSSGVTINQRLIEDMKRINDQIKTIAEKYKDKPEQSARSLLLGEVVQ